MSKDVPRITLAEASTEDQECQKSSLARDQLTTYLCRSCWLITLYYIHTYISNIVCPLSNLDISWENPGLDLLVHWIFVYQQIKGSVMEKPCALVSTFQARGYPWRCHAVVLQDKHQQLLCFVDCGSIWKKFVLDSSKNGFSCRGYLPCLICWKSLRPNAMTDQQVISSRTPKPSHVISFSESRENVLQLPVQVHHNWRHRCNHGWGLKYFFSILGVGKSCLLLQFTDKRFQPVRHLIIQSCVQSIPSFASFSFARCMT